MVGLGDLPGGTEASAAYAVSADGSLLVGYASSARGREAVYWTQPTGFVPLPDLPGADPSKPANATARETTPDGKVIVGNADGPNGTEAFRWSSETGMVGLGDLPGGAFFSGALDVSDDGNVIVGVSFDASDSKDFIWDPVRGMRPLLDVLIRDFGLTGVRDFVGPGGQPLNVRAISGDGMTIAGGNWIADLHGDFLPGDTNFDGAVDLADFGTLKANFGTGQYRNQGDFSADSRVDLTDFGLLKQNVGSTTTAVPEPSGGVLCCMAAAGVVACAAATRRRG